MATRNASKRQKSANQASKPEMTRGNRFLKEKDNVDKDISNAALLSTSACDFDRAQSRRLSNLTANGGVNCSHASCRNL